MQKAFHSALNCLRKCGQQYEEEHADDIIEKRQYGIDGDDRINLEKVLPFPFTERPRIGKDTFYSFLSCFIDVSSLFFSLLLVSSSTFSCLLYVITDWFIHLFVHLFIFLCIYFFVHLLIYILI